ncbi:hypothetical protein BDV40DRAFT_281392 [Aspergillus tamarii]|uniref:Uncharacterized protein n=1 Tax=Aspergillus tamarii TaxID=41984 RepID=A0A5N6UCR5_ASPTM|nr:hypothetical protein BDV40DRAFT_281392 [Aspergillus tamarii]
MVRFQRESSIAPVGPLCLDTRPWKEGSSSTDLFSYRPLWLNIVFFFFLPLHRLLLLFYHHHLLLHIILIFSFALLGENYYVSAFCPFP